MFLISPNNNCFSFKKLSYSKLNRSQPSPGTQLEKSLNNIKCLLQIRVEPFQSVSHTFTSELSSFHI